MTSVLYRSRRIIAAGTLAVVVLAALFRTPILRLAGQALVSADPVRQVDAIVVPQWAENGGAIEAADLVHLGFSSRVAVLVSSEPLADLELVKRGIISPSLESWYTRLIRSLGVSNVEQISSPVTGTETESELIPEWCARNGIRSVIVVSTPDHSRRLRRALRRSVKGYNITVIVSVTRYSDFDPNRWWVTREGVRTEIVELEKLALDVLQHPFA